MTTPATGIAPAAVESPPLLARSFARCVERVLDLPEGSCPAPDGDRVVGGLGEWLAARNLGLVPIAEPGSFSWPGSWIALLPHGEERRAVVMFGSPSGLLVDPLGISTTDPTAIDRGYLVAALDLHRGYGEDAYRDPTERGAGVVEAVLISPAKSEPCVRVRSAEAVAGLGLAGDRYAAGGGTFSARKRTGQDLTLIEAEALDDLLAETGVMLTAEEARRNVVTRGVDLNGLVGRRFALGTVVCRGTRLAEPCSHLQRLTRGGVLRGLVRRGGLRADILSGGVLRPGDELRVLD